ncbi:MAG: response regulator, partial [Lewinella sp.]|nr:response regulator [Lewinella sp.]
ERFVHYNTGDGLTSNVVRFLLEDSHDNIWLGTGGGGMNRINPDGFQHLILDHFTPDNDVSAISKDRNGNIWMGTNDGLYRYNDTAFLYYNREQGLPTSEIGVVLVDSRGHIWLGTKKGAIRMEPKNRRFVHFTGEQGLMNNNVKAIVEDRLGRIWLGTDSGLSCFSNNGFINYSIDNGLINDDIQVLLLDLEGHLWIGSKGGVSCLQFDDPTAEKIIHYSTGEQPAGNSVISLLQDRKGNIWVGTEGQGLSRFQYGSPQPDFIRYTIQDGLSNNTIWSLEEDRDGNIWMGTERGITVMVMPEEQCYTFRQEEGLKRLDFQVGSILLDDRNRMWWGTRGGVKLDLDQFELPSRQAQPVQLTHIDINNDYIDFKRLSDPAYQQIFRFGRQLSAAFDSVPAFANYPVNPTLPYSLNQLTFHFSAVNVPSREKVRYRYFLEGADDTWTYSKQNFSVPYRNLDPGWYSFKVQTTDETSKWSPPVSYDFRIRPPWWKTAWAYATYVLLGLAALYLGYRLSQHQLRLQHALDRRKAETQHLKELDTVKNRLYTNLTHAFRTPLTIILGMTDHVQQHVDEPLSEPLRLIRRNGQELLGLINRLLDLSKIEDKTFQLHLQQGDIVSFLRYLTNAFHTYAAGKGLKLGFSSDMDHLIMDYDPAQVQQVMSNLLSNAIKFTPSGGNIRVQLGQKEDLLRIEVVDTGIGIAPQEYTKIFDRFYQANSLQDHQRIGTGIGLAHARELVHLMDGTIEVSSERGLGTTFTVDLPIRNNSAIPHAESPLVLEVMPEFSQYYGEATSNDTKTSPIPVPEQMESSEQPLLLIIEDHTEVASYLRVCLQDNYQLEFAADGQEGIDKALRQIPDIIISDVMMPKKNGYEVCEAVKHDERTSHIPIILLTAKADTDSRLEGLSTGADAYLAKPFHQKELQIRLENMLENRQKIRDYFARKFEQGITIQPSSLATVSTLPPMEDAFLERIRKIVEANYDDENFSLPQLCQEIGMSRSQLYRKMKALIDTSPSDFIRTYRLEKARELLASEELNVSEAAWRTGFKDVAHFSKLFLDAFGYSPSQEKN